MGVRRAAAALVAVFVLFLGVTVARAATPSDAAVNAGRYLVSRQAADGSWANATHAENVADGVVGLVAAGVAGEPLTKALNFVAGHGPADANRASATARVILAIVAAGKNPRDFGKVDYVGRLRTYFNPNNGAYDSSTDPNSLAILALAGAKDAVPERAVTSLQGRQCGDGGFPRSSCIFGSDVESTALAMDAMVTVGVGSSDPVYDTARTYLLNGQNADGGYGQNVGGVTAAQPTSAVLSALVALGEDVSVAPWHKPGHPTSTAALVALQDASTGGLRPDTNTAVADEVTTFRALPGLAGRALPVRPESAVPATTTSTVATGGGPAATTTSAPRAATATTTRRSALTAPTIPATPATAADNQVGLATRRDGGNANGRSLVGLAPFVVTLFGAGTVGLVLRRRART